jgi:hypothetical protein
MSDTPTGFVPTEIPPRVAELGFTFLRPGDWTVAALPEETVDFEQPAAFLPLCVAHATYAALVFSVGARPAYPDGTVAEWLQWLVAQQGFDAGPIEAEAVGSHAAVACWAMQTQGDVVMRMRLVLLEDGGRLVNLSAMAPMPLWPAAGSVLRTMVDSFRLSAPRGPSALLAPADTSLPPSTYVAGAEPAPAPPAATAQPQGQAPPTTYAELARAEDAGTLGPEHPQNVRMREGGIGFAPRVLAVDPELRCATVGTSALVATLRVPFGWFALDDGRRLLVYDPAGDVQVNLDRRSRGGQDPDAFLEGLRGELNQQWPAAQFLRTRLGGMECLALRGLEVDGQPIEQAFLLGDAPGQSFLVVRATAGPQGITQAMDLAELLLRDLRFLDPAA